LAAVLATAAGCAVSAGKAGGTTFPTEAEATSASAPAPPMAPTSDPAKPAAPPKEECDAFMDVIARTTILRASIHRDAATAPKAADWAVRSAQIATLATALQLKNPDLLIENAKLATRMSELAAELRGLVQAAAGSGDKTAAHQRVIKMSEQIEVITREPAARCAGDTRSLIATSGHLRSDAIQAAIRDRLPLAAKCYKEGLARDPKLEGRVLVRLVIGLDGKVIEASPATADASADAQTPGDTPMPPMKDAKVVACVVDVLKKTVFPAPDGGTVTVVYPVTLSRTQ
jgi:hypothetical protein